MPLLLLNVCLFVYLYIGEDTLRNKRDQGLQCEEAVLPSATRLLRRYDRKGVQSNRQSSNVTEEELVPSYSKAHF